MTLNMQTIQSLSIKVDTDGTMYLVAPDEAPVARSVPSETAFSFAKRLGTALPPAVVASLALRASRRYETARKMRCLAIADGARIAIAG